MNELVILTAGVAALLFMIIRLNINTFVSLIVISILIGIGLEIPLAQIPVSIMNGIGSTLDELTIVFGFGAIIGRLVADAGGTYRISKTLIKLVGPKYIQWAIVASSLVVGIALFFEVGMVLLVPIVFAVAIEAELPLLFLGIPMAAGLAVTHGLLPPYPAPTAVSAVFGVNPGIVLIYGIIIAVPTVAIAGPLFTKVARQFVPDAFVNKRKLNTFGEIKTWNLSETPSFRISILTSMMPAILMSIAAFYSIICGSNAPKVTTRIINGVSQSIYPSGIDGIMMFLGNPVIAMVISLIFAMWSMGWHIKKTSKELAKSSESAIRSISMILMIVAGGASLKQILIDGGISKQISQLFIHSSISPLILAWFITVILRIVLGSATVAGLTSAGMVSEFTGLISPEKSVLMVLAIGAGSIAVSHVNDAGFWMFKESFDLDVKQTLKTWTVFNTIISVVALGIILLLDFWIG